MTVGMDCVGVKSDCRGANWTGWRYLAELLTELGCRMDELVFSNDGDIVSEGTARQYGEAIKNAINGDHVFEIQVADEYFPKDFVKKPVVLGYGNLTVNNMCIEARDVQYVSYIELKTQPTRMIKIHSVLPDPATGRTLMDLVTGQKFRKIDDETKEWLLDWADFFINSGGFYQT